MRLILILLLAIFSLSAETEVGSFVRPSVTYLELLLKREKGTATLSKAAEDTIVSLLNDVVTLTRFDHNPISESELNLCREVVKRSDSLARDGMLKRATACLEKSIVEPILEEVNRSRSERASVIRTSQQRNSFIHDKAKEEGYTSGELERVGRSAFIFAPMVQEFNSKLRRDTVIVSDTTITADTLSVVRDTIQQSEVASLDPMRIYYNTKISNPIELLDIPGDTVHLEKVSFRLALDTIIISDTTITKTRVVHLNVGLVWWQILPDDSSTNSLKQFPPIFYSETKEIDPTQRYTIGGKELSPELYAVWHISQEASVRFKAKIRDFDTFRLTGQIESQNRLSVQFDLGGESLLIDDKFLLMGTRESEDGALESYRAGWVIVNRFAKDGNSVTARVIAGQSYVGMVIQEKPMGHGELGFFYRSYSHEADVQDSPDGLLRGFAVDNLRGPALELVGNIGRKMRVSQLFLVLGAGFGHGDASGSLHGDSAVAYTISDALAGFYDLSLKKRFNLKRIGLFAQIGGGVEHRQYRLKPESWVEESAHLGQWNFVGFIRGGTDIAITPGLHLSGAVSYRYCDESSMKFSGSGAGSDRVAQGATLSNGPSVSGSGIGWNLGLIAQPFVRLRDRR